MLRKYGIPEWVKPYIYAYIKRDPINAVKRGMSFIDVKRKRGRVTSTKVELPNSIAFDIDNITRIISLFYYGEEESIKVAGAWSKAAHDYDSKRYADHFAEMRDIEEKRLRAIKNLLEGIGKKCNPLTKEVKAIFDYMSSLPDWQDRIIAYDLILRKSYGATFGTIFYKVFYPVMPEYMRSFGKAFNYDSEEISWGELEAKRLISEGIIGHPRLMQLFDEMLPLICVSINSNLDIAQKTGIKREVELLRDISIAFPMQVAKENGMEIDIAAESKKILQRAAKLESSMKDLND